MNDDRLRDLLQEAHAGDRPPPFRVPEPRRRFPVMALASSALVLVVVLVAVFYRRPPPAPNLALPALHYPTDFLLQAPGLAVLEPTKGLLQ